MRTRSRPSLGITVLLALVLGVTACEEEREPDAERRTTAGHGATSAPPSGTIGMAELEGPVYAYRIWLDSLARHDAADACTWQAPELTIALRYDAVLLDRAELGDPCVDFVALLWEDAGFESEVADVEVTQRTEEDALLAVTFASGAEQTVRMVHHRAKWRVLSTGDRADGDEAAGPARWVAAWCDLSPDMSRQEIVTLMGEPSGEYTVADGGEPQLWWAQDQYDFRAYLDVDGSVLELVGDYDALGQDDRARLTCPELRS